MSAEDQQQAAEIAATTLEWRVELGERIKEQDEQLISIRGELAENTKVTKYLAEKIEELAPLTDLMAGLRPLAKAGEVLGKVFGWIGRKTKPILGWAAAAATLYYAIKNGGIGPK